MSIRLFFADCRPKIFSNAQPLADFARRSDKNVVYSMWFRCLKNKGNFARPGSKLDIQTRVKDPLLSKRSGIQLFVVLIR